MERANVARGDGSVIGNNESAYSAVSWGAITVGAIIAAALMAMLVIGGTGLGFLAISPWQHEGISGEAFAIGSIFWLLFAHVVAYGVAGYVTGRLRTKWTDVHGDEIYFRDTAHGFAVWALGSVIGLVLLSVNAATMIPNAASTGASLAQSGATTVLAASAGGSGEDNSSGTSLDYYADALLRPSDPEQHSSSEAVRPEITRIFMHSMSAGEISGQDRDYLVKVIADRADISPEQAQQRLDSIQSQAKQTIDGVKQKARQVADEARKTAAKLALWAFAALLLGAFVASFSATLGGRARDL